MTEEIHYKAGVVLLRKNDWGKAEVVLVHRVSLQDWVLPKGHIEPGETAEECALRELTEESGWTGELLGFVEDVEYVSDKPGLPRHHAKVKYFAAKPVVLDLAQAHADEVDGMGWFEVGEQSDMVLSHANDKDTVRKAAQLFG